MTYSGESVPSARVVVAQRERRAPALELVPPVALLLVTAAAVVVPRGPQRARQLDDDLAGVAHDRHVGRPVLADLGRVDVGVDDLRLGGEGREVAGDAVVEPRAEGDQQVGLLHRRDGGDGAVHARHAQVLAVAIGERAAGHEGGDDGRAGLVGEVEELGGGLGLDHAAADVEHRATRLADQAGGLPDLLGVRPGGRPVAGQPDLDRPAEGGLGLQDVLGQVDEHRAGTAGRGDVERLGDRPRDVRRVGDQHVVLGDRQRDAADVGFLERVGADELAARPAR